MSKRIADKDPCLPRIRVTDAGVPRVDPKILADALGAEECPEQLEGRPGPITLYALRSEMMRRRHSSGGRPGIDGTDLRAKIPLSDQEWAKLESLAAALATQGCSPSPGQVGSILLSIALRSLAGDGSLTEAVNHELGTRKK